MRILSIRLKNLNSLVGEWCVDFTHPAYVSNGLFAITGPTGAGKSTLLDAICLALYGRTPRLPRVGKSSNEIMSRQAGECFAEVTFATQKGVFRCHWSQHRSRRKAGGELQAPKHELSEADSGTVLGSSFRDVANQVEELTGLDFERFTRSMMLAQGSFAAFLLASPDERSPLLEQITGTEIYSRISMQVHERRSRERKALEMLQVALSGLVPLSAEEEAQLLIDIQHHEHARAQLELDLAGQQRIVSWLNDIASHENALSQIANDEASLHAAQQAFLPDQQRLNAAQRALELAADHASLSALRTAQKQDLDQQNTLRAEHTHQMQALADTAQALANAEAELRQTYEAWQQAQPKLRQARELDLTIAEKNRALAEADHHRHEQEAELNQLQTLQQQASAKLAHCTSEQAELQNKLAAHASDAQLVEQLAGIETRADLLGTQHQRLLKLRSQLNDLAQQQQQYAQQRDTLTAQQRTADAELAHQQQTLDTLRQRLQDILQGRPHADWRNRQQQCLNSQTRLQQAADLCQQALEIQHQLQQREARLAELKRHHQDTVTQLQGQEAELKACQQRVEAYEEELARLQRIRSLEEARQHLHAGEPCPLCGALEHPYAGQALPTDETARHALQTAKDELHRLNESLQTLRVQRARLEAEQQHQHTTIEQQRAALGATQDRLGRLENALADTALWPTELSAQLPYLHAHIEQAAQQRQHIDQALLQAETLERDAITAQQQLDQARERASAARTATQLAEQRLISARQEHTRADAELVSEQQQFDQALAEWQSHLLPYLAATEDLGSFTIERLPTLLADLRTRRQRWLDGQQHLHQLGQQVTELRAQIEQRALQVTKTQANVAAATGRQTQLANELTALRAQRYEVLADLQPDAEETRLQDMQQRQQQTVTRAQHAHHTAQTALQQTQRLLDELAQRLAQRTLELTQQEQAFTARLQATQFTDEASWLSACLPETERQQLTQQAQALQQRATELHARKQQHRERLTALREQALSAQPREEHEARVQQLQLELRAQQENLGGLKQKLQANENLKQQQQTQLERIEAQKRECARWDDLHELIGSSDGKKFRNFAQGLTFERMIDHANRQLQAMSDRYLLIRDRSQPLELNVIDQYQAGEIRSTKNLSGGESFIVSLALALGLSQMASQNVRVDSLFLDEGFGTLDEDALDMALGTLGNLHQDGKMIGIISHVAALKERIGTQIQVQPLSGGRSQLSGPGCSRGTD